MKKLFLPSLALYALVSIASAEQVFNYPAEEPSFSIAFPDGWEVSSEEEDSLSAAPKDELVSVELIALEADGAEGAIAEAKAAFEELYEEFKADKIQEGKVNDMAVELFNAKGTDEDGNIYNINCALFSPADGETYFMLFCVGTPEGSAKHADALSTILQSIKGS